MSSFLDVPYPTDLDLSSLPALVKATKTQDLKLAAKASTHIIDFCAGRFIGEPGSPVVHGFGDASGLVSLDMVDRSTPFSEDEVETFDPSSKTFQFLPIVDVIMIARALATAIQYAPELRDVIKKLLHK
jgi:hypothetical protein